MLCCLWQELSRRLTGAMKDAHTKSVTGMKEKMRELAKNLGIPVRPPIILMYLYCDLPFACIVVCAVCAVSRCSFGFYGVACLLRG